LTKSSTISKRGMPSYFANRNSSLTATPRLCMTFVQCQSDECDEWNFMQVLTFGFCQCQMRVRSWLTQP
jgi:hypothetical protein